jgi:ribonuclease-3
MTLPDFKDPSLLRRALTHRSYLNEHPEQQTDNERLEFLGDAVLDFVTGAFLYHQFPEMHEGQLTRLRAALVKTEQLAAFAEQLKLNERMLVGKGEEEAGGRQRHSLLCAVFEAVIGAYFLDSGIEAARCFVEPLFQPVAEAIVRAESDMDSKSLFQEWAQAEMGQTPHYVLVATTGPDHEKEFVMEVRLGEDTFGTGAGRNKRLAAQAAAHNAMLRLGLVSNNSEET